MISWLERYEGKIITALSVILVGFGVGLFLSKEYYSGMEASLVGLLVYSIYLISSKLDEFI
ncbi:hypothetical protein YDYSY3_08250 [Paenibacillus chitinolyticus]|nr:hypothetical protein YDYSY3_08250 [Paenibacillus chitinolyticus]